jgi:hypothetical protein
MRNFVTEPIKDRYYPAKKKKNKVDQKFCRIDQQVVTVLYCWGAGNILKISKGHRRGSGTKCFAAA